MRINVTAQNYKVQVLSNEGAELLRYEAENSEFSADLHEIINTFANEAVNFLELDRRVRRARSE